MNDYAISVRNLVKEFNGFKLGPLNLTIPRGCIVGYIGQNGAGKSTTIKLLLGLVKRTSGDLEVLGNTNPEDIDIKDRLGVVFDNLLMPEEMNSSDVDKFCTRIYSKWEKKKYHELLKRFDIPKDKPIKSYSRGMRMKLSIAIALAHNAELLFLDEATSGLDPVVREDILDILMEYIQDENHTVLISSHILSDLEKIADYIAFIYRGKILFFEAKDDLKDNYVLCNISDEESKLFAEDAIVGRRKHAFGQEILVKRDKVPRDIDFRRPSIEDIMIYFVKGMERK
ncbi:MAG: ABC transporter ATP-binding protein [Clostridiales bacterium]|uniref:ABC transporter ATP-binding protein n=1 Tax=Peptostreptococcus porci TaxID=2652282 RepID=UPI0029DAFB8E|nr:ABC transporter ATP-binding protein [Peptostreptococcus porci]MCI5698702.1 ABC transporter ATP-binding protein [Clostridiales bacterium]MDY4060799.1 ABC transporter ATP-binding protein [Anaerovoracaceae bacterium]MDY4129003.1 ABC transporter ATP-binding protein [Peptostreptococcus porci]